MIFNIILIVIVFCFSMINKIHKNCDEHSQDVICFKIQFSVHRCEFFWILVIVVGTHLFMSYPKTEIPRCASELIVIKTYKLCEEVNFFPLSVSNLDDASEDYFWRRKYSPTDTHFSEDVCPVLG